MNIGENARSRVTPASVGACQSFGGRTFSLNDISPTKLPGGVYRITMTNRPSCLVAEAAPICFVVFHTI